MSARQKMRWGWMAMGLCAGLLVSYVPAQQPIPNQPDRPEQREFQPARPGVSLQSTARAQNPEVDRYLAACLLAKNEAEIEISQFAQQQSKNEQVKQFAQQIIADHREMAQKLQQVAGMRSDTRQSRAGQAAGATGQFDVRRQAQQQPGRQFDEQRRPDGSSQLAGAQGDAVNNLIAIERQIVEQATKSLREQLQEKSPSEIDQCYLASQVACHMQLKAALEVIQAHTAGELQQIAQQQQQTVDQHLKKAEQLLEQATGARQPGQAARPQVDGSRRLSR